MRKCGENKMLWKTPIYKFRVPLSQESEDLQEVVFDVTGSAPPFNDVKDTMRGVFDKLLSEEGKKADKILDFGAAKLRNTLYFLDKGKKVCAVEFEELSKKSSDAKEILKKCQKSKNFQKLVFPHPFIDHNEKYDLVLLINVLPVMPVFAERLLSLQLLNQKINELGYVLWYAQKEGSYKEIREKGKNDFGDGIWMGTNKRFKTFYKYNEIEDVDEMMALCGFQYIKKFLAPGNDVRLYQKTKYNLFSEIIKPKDILDVIPIDNSVEDPKDSKFKKVKRKNRIKEILPNPSSLSLENLYRKVLENIKPGQENAEVYHRIASHIIYRVFRGSLRNMEIKQDTDKGLKIIDTVFTNNAENGFFANLSKNFQIKCPYIILEAKNYNFDPKNPEFDQLAGRLKDNIGKFGILVCRGIDNLDIVKQRCESYLDDGGKHIIFLIDDDLINLLEMYQDGDFKGIDDFMDKKIRPLVFKSKK